MKTLYKEASHLRAHTWRDIGGVGGLFLDGIYFLFLVGVSGIVLVAGAIMVVVDYVFSPLLSLASMCRNTRRQDLDNAVLLEDGTLGEKPAEQTNKTTAEDVLYPF